MSTLDTLPASIDVGTGEITPYNIDITNLLLDGDSLQTQPSPSAQVISNSNNAVVTTGLVGAPGVSGNIVQVNLNCPALRPKQTYSLIGTFYVTATKKLQFRVIINVIF